MSIDHSAPLKGVVICCTSIPDEKRTTIALYAEQMGALHHLDLTRDVTHLIIGSYDTLKYKYVARNRQDILPMTPAWIEAIRDSWIADEEIDLEAMERKYRLPTFHSLKFSMTGCEEPAERLGISELVKKNGATYDGDLTRSITHLISLRTDGAKYKAAKSWGLKIVSIEWLYQSLERGMILEEKLFDPTLPKEERGKGAWDKTTPLRPLHVRRLKPESCTVAETGKRKLRKTASMKLSGQHDSLLADISGSEVISKSQRNGAREIEKLTQINTSATTDQSKPQAVQKNSEDRSPARITGVFTGCVFWLHDFPDTKIKVLQNHILSCGGEVMHTVNKSVSLPTVLPEGRRSQRFFMVVSHNLSKADVPIFPMSHPIEVVTVWWIERCLHHKQFLEPKHHIIGRPFPVFPIPEIVAKKMIICSSAFSGIDLLHLTRAIELIGGTYSDFMTPHASLLIVNNVNTVRKEKLNYAKEWKIPVVTANWLWDSIEAGSSLSIQVYESGPEKMLESTLTLKEKPIKIVEIEQKKPSSTPVAPLPITGKDVTLTLDKLSQPSSNSGPEINDAREKSMETEKNVILIPSQSQSEPLVILNHSENNSDSLTHSLKMVIGPSERSESLHHTSEDINHAISSLLAKSKGTTSNQSLERTETRKRSRILGRVTSNTSNQSHATSVDSTATHGDPVQWFSNSSDQTANERIEMLLNGDRAWMPNIENNNLPSTQLQYEDPDSTVAREVIMARMRGEVIDFETVKKLENKRTMSAFDNSKDMMSKGRKRVRGNNSR
ncbi:S-M checkpoint control protein rad4 [Erysiphe neolycopersici]|uniref:S-M checkpoint control protein rad4 n=1 Tax=Erysiphe neolycopersici TaxID=212602 RepID=A0A420HY02_9PEZI|nr:S-M checkpoint control protein rad4 [Erysiphe neolycopersici]